MTVASLWKALDQAGCGQPVGEEDMIDPQKRTAKVNPWTFNDQQRREQRIEDRPSLAVDLSIWICESLTSTAMNDFNENPALHLVFTRTMKLLRMGIKLVVVIEGKRRIRAQNSNDKPDKFRRRRSGTTFWRACTQCETMLKFMGVPVVRAKAEGEALCALLNQQGIVDGVISNDGDCLLFGAKVVYTKFSIDNLDKGCVMRYDASSLYAIAEGTTEEAPGGTATAANKNVRETATTNDKTSVSIALSREDLVAFALLTGSDLAGDGIDKVGHKKATRFIRKCKLDRPLSVASAAMDELRSWARSVKPIDDTIVEDNQDGEEEDFADNDLEEENGKGTNDQKKKASCCSRCSHVGSKRSHQKHGCEVCGTGPGEPCYKLSTEDKFRKSLRAKAIALRDPKFDPTLVVNAYMRPNDNQLPASLLSKGMSSKKTLRMEYPRLKDFIAWRTTVKGHCLKASQDFIKQSVSRLLVRTELFQNPSSGANQEQGQDGAVPLRRCPRERPVPKEIMRKLVQNGIECYEVCWIMQATVTDKDGEGIDGYEFSSIEPQAMVSRQHPDIVAAFQKNPPQATKEQGDAEMQKRREFLESLFQPAEEKLATKQPADWDKDKRIFKQPAATSGKVPYAKAPPKERKKKHCKTGGTDVALLMHSLKIPTKSKTTDNVEEFDFSSIESGSLASKECAEEDVKARDQPISPLKEPPEEVNPTQGKELPPPRQKPKEAGASSDLGDDQLSVLVQLPLSAVKNRKHNDDRREVPSNVSVPTPPHDKKPAANRNPHPHQHHQVDVHQFSRRRKASTPNKRQPRQPKRSRQKSPRAPTEGQGYGNHSRGASHVVRKSEGFHRTSFPEAEEMEHNHHHLEGGRELMFHEENESAVRKEVTFAEPKTNSPTNCCRACGVRALPERDRGRIDQQVDMSGLNQCNEYNAADEERLYEPEVHFTKARSFTEKSCKTESQGYQMDDIGPDHHDAVKDPRLRFVHEDYPKDFDRPRRSKGRGRQHKAKSPDPGREFYRGILPTDDMHADEKEYLDGLHAPKRSTSRRHRNDFEAAVSQASFRDNSQDDCLDEDMHYDGDYDEDEPIQRGDAKRSSSRPVEFDLKSRRRVPEFKKRHYNSQRGEADVTPAFINIESIHDIQSDGSDQLLSHRRHEHSRRTMNQPVQKQRLFGPSNHDRAPRASKSRGGRSPTARKNREGTSAKGRALRDRGFPRANTSNRTRRRSLGKHRHGSSRRLRSLMDTGSPRASDKRRGERYVHRNIAGDISEPNSWTREELVSDSHHERQLADEIYDEKFSDDDRYPSDEYTDDCDIYDNRGHSEDELCDDPDEESVDHFDDQVRRHHRDHQLRDRFHDVQLHDRLNHQLHRSRKHGGREADGQHEPDYGSFDEMDDYSDASEIPNYNLDIVGADAMPEVPYQKERADELGCGGDQDERLLMLDPYVDIGRKRRNPLRTRSNKEGPKFGVDSDRNDTRPRDICRRRRNRSPGHGKPSKGRDPRYHHSSRTTFERERHDERSRMGRERRVHMENNVHEHLKRRVHGQHGSIHDDDISFDGSFATNNSDGNLHQEQFRDDESLDQHHHYEDMSFEENMRYEDMP